MNVTSVTGQPSLFVDPLARRVPQNVRAAVEPKLPETQNIRGKPTFEVPDPAPTGLPRTAPNPRAMFDGLLANWGTSQYVIEMLSRN